MSLQIKNARLCFAHLFEPKAPRAGGKLKYSVDVLIPKSDKAQLALVVKEIQAAAAEKYKEKATGFLASIKGNNAKNAFRDGDVKVSGEGKEYTDYKGCYYITTKSDNPPVVLTRNRVQVTNDNKASMQDVPYSGCYANVLLHFYALGGENAGVFSGLDGVQFVKDGPRLSGGASTTQVVDAFADLLDEVPQAASDEDAMAALGL